MYFLLPSYTLITFLKVLSHLKILWNISKKGSWNISKCASLYTRWVKKVSFCHNFIKYWLFFIFFIGTLSNKFATKWSLSIPLHLKRVAILPCKILMPESQRALCSVAVLMKVELAKVLTCDRQQLQFYIKTCLLQTLLLITVSISGIGCKNFQIIFL